MKNIKYFFRISIIFILFLILSNKPILNIAFAETNQIYLIEQTANILSSIKYFLDYFQKVLSKFGWKQLAQISHPLIEEYISNGSFENIDASKNDPIGWIDNGFISDTSVARTGSASYKITNSNLIPYSQSASQEINLSAGTYSASIWVKLEGMAATQGSGVRICLSAPPSYPWNIARACSNLVKGTSDWQQLNINRFNLSQDSLVSFSIETYGEPDGTAWFDDASLTVYQGPDTNPPFVSITSPLNGSTISGNIIISAIASDDKGIAGVQFKINNNNLGNEILTPPFTINWDTNSISNGTYIISAVARDTSNNTSSASVQINIQNLDITPPQINNVFVSNITHSQATINWTTNEQSDSKVEYGETTSYGLSKSDSQFVIDHSLQLTNLIPGKQYNYRVISKDSSGNIAISQNYTFMTQSLISLPQCSDGLDNDMDGLKDYPEDPGCINSSDVEEFNIPSPPEIINGLIAGGILWLPSIYLGNNLLLNNSFEELDVNNKPLNWSGSAAFSIDSTIAKSGTKSYKMKDAPNFPYTESASQQIYLKKGSYTINGWIKTNLYDPNPNDSITPCVRINLAGKTSKCISGLTDWQYVEVKNIVITQDGNAAFRLESWNEPGGEAWFDDLELREEIPPPIDVFMLYPNYRGYLFDDQSSQMKFDITITPPPSTQLNDWKIVAEVWDENSNIKLSSQIFNLSTNNFIANIDGSRLSLGKPYLIRFKLVRLIDNATIYEYPPYRIFPVSGSVRSSMVISFDENNRILFKGKPKFLIGVYDSGMGYSNTESFWEDTLFSTSSSGYRRLNELPINLYNNYWYGETPVSSMQAMSNVLQKKGVYFIHTGNCFGSGFNKNFPIYINDSYLSQLSNIDNLAGFYIMDECIPELAKQVFDSALRLKKFKPDGINFGASTDPKTLFYWREVVDLLSTDPYPLYGAEPQTGYKLNQVADWTKATKETLKNSRPFATVIQFFQFTSLGRWPKLDELRNMSYMAITEGANGIFYWSLGANALAYICPDETQNQDLDGDGVYGEYKQRVWCQERMEYFNRLKSVVQELNSLQSPLSSLDNPNLLTFNSNPNIRTRIKYANNKGYLIAYNYTNINQDTTFTWAQKPTQVLVYNEGRILPLNGSSFTDNFGPYQAHIYEINTSQDSINTISSYTNTSSSISIQPNTSPSSYISNVSQPQSYTTLTTTTESITTSSSLTTSKNSDLCKLQLKIILSAINQIQDIITSTIKLDIKSQKILLIDIKNLLLIILDLINKIKTLC